MKFSLERLLVPWTLLAQVYCWPTNGQPDLSDPQYLQRRDSSFRKYLSDRPYDGSSNFGKRDMQSNNFVVPGRSTADNYHGTAARNVDWAGLMTSQNSKSVPKFRKTASYALGSPIERRGFAGDTPLGVGEEFRQTGDISKMSDLLDNEGYARQGVDVLDGNTGKMSAFWNPASRDTWPLSRNSYERILNAMRRTFQDYDENEWEDES